jgi:hypothetical protein
MEFSKKNAGWERTEVELDGLVIRREGNNSDANCTPVDAKKLHEAYSSSNERCWGCINMFRKPEQKGKNPGLDKLWMAYEQMDRLSPPMLWKLIADVHYKAIYEPAIKRGEPCETWPESMVEAHFVGGHTIDRHMDTRNSIHLIKTFERVLSDQIVVENEDGKYAINEKKLKLLLDLEDRKQKMYASLQTNNVGGAT